MVELVEAHLFVFCAVMTFQNIFSALHFFVLVETAGCLWAKVMEEAFKLKKQ